MHDRFRIALAIGAVVGSSMTTAADAGPPTAGPTGNPCNAAAVGDPHPEASAGAKIGIVQAGPLVWDRPFTVICTVQVNDYAHSGPDQFVAVEESSPADSGTHVATLAATMSFTSGDEDAEYLCTAVRYDGNATIYWHPADSGPDGIPNTSDDTPGHWSNDPGTLCLASTKSFGSGGCTTTLVSSIGNRPFPNTPFETIGYAVDTASDVEDFVDCVV